MTNAETEVPLTGGRTTRNVVRVEDTVRKPATENSAFVRRLLEYLTDIGSDFSPKFLGIDGNGRDVLSFIDGQVPGELAYYDEPTLCEAAALIRRFHDLSSGLVDSPKATKMGTEVVCHNDLSPCNFVFRGDSPVAIIDYDASAPGSRAHDLGYAAWLWLDLGSSEVSARDQRQRLSTFVEAYGALRVDSVLEAMLERQALLVREGRRTGNNAMSEWATACNDWTRGNRRILRGY